MKVETMIVHGDYAKAHELQALLLEALNPFNCPWS